MSVATRPLFAFDNTFARDLPGLYVPWQPKAVTAPQPLLLNRELATDLGLDADAFGNPEALAALAGNAVPDGATPIAMAYAGHQFGGYSPRLGDGRALLLGEILDRAGNRRDVHLKGSGRTPFARGGDGRAAIGPMLREYVIGEALHGLGIPTTRALAVVATGEQIARETGLLPGAVLTRVAASHLRVGTFQYAAAQQDDPGLLRRLADYALARHPTSGTAAAEQPALALLRAVIDRQASLIAAWMAVGFIHGVLNTDNVTISGESIDFGPCAFMDAFDPATVFSSIDETGRYAYRNQPAIGLWNLTRFAETLLPLIAEDLDGDVKGEQDAAIEAAKDALDGFAGRFEVHWLARMHAKLGLPAPAQGAAAADATLVQDLLGLLYADKVDYTSAFRALAFVLRGDPAPARDLFLDRDGFDAWATSWRAALADGSREDAETAAAMDRTNPLYLARNHLVEAALDAATDGDLAPVRLLLDAVSAPFDARPGLDAYTEPAPADFGPYRTFCGT